MNTDSDIQRQTVHQHEQVVAQNPVKRSPPRNKAYIWPSIETLQIGRQWQDRHSDVVLVPLIKISVLTNTGRKPLCSKHSKEWFSSIDIELAEYQDEKSLFQSIDSNFKTTHFFIINSSKHVQPLVDRAHSYPIVRSIYVHCETAQLLQQRRLARNYSKLDAVFDNPLRLLIKLTMDLALFCEETADRQKHDASLLQAARRNYQRSIDLYRFAENMVE